MQFHSPSCRRVPVLAALAAMVALAFATPALAAEGHDDDHGYGRPGDPKNVDRTVRVDAVDTDFGRDRIPVQSGQTVRFVITNSGSSAHEFTIGPPSVQRAHRREMAEAMGEGHGGSQMSHGHGNSVMVPPGESRELVWHFAEVHDLEFACNVPGHYEAGMHGEFVHGH